MSITKHVTLQKIVAHDFRYVPRNKLENITQMGGIFGGIRLTQKEFWLGNLKEFYYLGNCMMCK